MKTLYGILTSIIITIASFAQSPSLDTGLIAHYPFNGNASDVTGNGYNGKVNGATLATDRAGIADSAYQFGNGNTSITIPFKTNIFAKDFTISVWFNADSISEGWPTILQTQGDYSISNIPFTIGISGLQCGCAYPGGLNAGASYAPATHSWFLSPRKQTPIGKFNQAVVVKSGGTVTMYLNSQIWEQGVVATPTTRTGNTLWIGRAPSEDTAGTTGFHGILDDIRIYNRALSVQEVKNLYRYELPVFPTINIEVETVRLTMHVTPSKRYQLESSFDFKSWMKVDDSFVAETSEVYVTVNVTMIGQFFRVYEVR